MRRTIILLFLLIAPLAMMGYVIKRGPLPRDVIVNVLDYGAVADAVVASGTAPNCTPQTLSTCTTPGTGTDNTAAFEAAEAVLAAAGGGILEIPCGDYRIGDPDGVDGQIYDGWILNTSNVWVRGHGACTRLLPNNPNGQAVIAVCKSSTCAVGDQDITSATNATNTLNLNAHGYSDGDGPYWLAAADLPLGLTEQTDYWIRDSAENTFKLTTYPGGPVATFSDDGTPTFQIANADQIHDIKFSDFLIYDDDPEAHGRGYMIVDEGTLGGGTPAAGDDVEWNIGGPTEDGTVVDYDSDNGIIRILGDARSTDVIADGDDVSVVGGGSWTATGVVITDFDGNGNSGLGTSEESHGLYIRAVNGLTIENVTVERLGEEAIDLLNASGGVVPNRNVEILNVKGVNIPGIASGGATVNLDGSHNALIDGLITEGGFGGPSATARGIILSGNGGVDGKNITIKNSKIGAVQNGGVQTGTNVGISVGGSGADWSNIIIEGNYVNEDNTIDSAIAVAGNIDGLTINNNHIVGSLDLSGSGISDLIFSNNVVNISTANPEYAIQIGADSAKILDNNILGGTGGCVKVTGGDDITIKGNYCGTNTDGTDDHVMIFYTGTCPVNRLLVADNFIVPVGAATYGIAGPPSSSCPTITASRNSVYIANPDATTVGIRDMTFTFDNYVEIVGDATAGIQFTAMDNPGIISGNHVKMDNANDDGISILNSSEIMVSNNFIENVTGAGSAIQESGTSDHNTFIGNLSTAEGGGTGGAAFDVGVTPGGGCTGSGTGYASYCSGNRVRGDQTNDVSDGILYASVNPTEAQGTDDFMSMNDHAGSTVEGNEDDYVIAPGAVTFHSLYCKIDVAPGAGDEWRIVVRDDGGDTAVTCDISDSATSCSDLTNTAAAAVGSLCNFDITSSTGATDPEAAALITCSVRIGP